MEPLKIATGFLPREILATAQKDFIVILGGATQLQLGGPTAFALQQTSFYFCPDLGMDVFFLVLQHDVSGLLKQIHRTPLLGTLVPQTAKFSLGVETMDELLGMKRVHLVQ